MEALSALKVPTRREELDGIGAALGKSACVHYGAYRRGLGFTCISGERALSRLGTRMGSDLNMTPGTGGLILRTSCGRIPLPFRAGTCSAKGHWHSRSSKDR